MVDAKRIEAPSLADDGTDPTADAKKHGDAALMSAARDAFDGDPYSYVCTPDGRLVDHAGADPVVTGHAFVPVAIVRQIADVPYEIEDRRVVEGRAVRGLHRPVFGDDGELLGVAGRYVDLAPSAQTKDHSPDAASEPSAIAYEAALEDTERRLHEVELQLAQALEDSGRKNVFLASMAHELRTPLNAVIGFSEAALGEIVGPLPTAYRGYLENILRAGRHLGALAESVLETARLERGECDCQIEVVDLAEIVDEARGIVSGRAERGGIDLSGVSVAPATTVLADPLRTRQIVINLLANAITFTSPGGAIGIDLAPVGDGTLAVVVWDTGIGIEPAEQDRIFEAYYQVTTSRRSDRGGAGLGLAIARRFARAMGGDILLESTPGQGSRFTILLTRALPNAGRLSA